VQQSPSHEIPVISLPVFDHLFVHGTMMEFCPLQASDLPSYMHMNHNVYVQCTSLRILQAAWYPDDFHITWFAGAWGDLLKLGPWP